MAEVLAVKNGVVLPRDMEVARAKNDLKIAFNTPVDVNWAKTAVETVALVVVVQPS